MSIDACLLRLFKAVQVDSVELSKPKKKLPFNILERCLEKGYVVQPGVPCTSEMLTTIEHVLGLTITQANASFHKSLGVVATSPMRTLMAQQLAHYISTYGYEQWGIFSNDTVYYPPEILADIPGLDSKKVKALPLLVIKALTKDQVYDKIVGMGSGVALSDKILSDIMEVIAVNKFGSELLEKIKNYELKARLYDHLGLAPFDPVEFLRYMVFSLTGKSLLIKNKESFKELASSDSKKAQALIDKAPENLAEIFYRFKPLFLAIRKALADKEPINRLRRQAERMHKPLKPDLMSSFVGLALSSTGINVKSLEKALTKASIVRKIRLGNAIAFAMDNADDSIVYHVRNGKGYVTEWGKSVSSSDLRTLAVAHDVATQSIADDVSKNVEGKKIFIPKFIDYTIPCTEKQFTGYIPTGSSVSFGEDTLVGIHWFDVEPNNSIWSGSGRVDLDLSVVDCTGKMGWDADWKSRYSKSVIFSGDVTSAPKPDGAAEYFYFKKTAVPFAKLLLVNFYNKSDFDKDTAVESKIILAGKDAIDIHRKYVIDLNEVLAVSPMQISQSQTVLGLLVSENGSAKFYFANVAIGKGRTSVVGHQSEGVRKYLLNRVKSYMKLAPILKAAGAKIVNERPKKGDYIDLSPGALDKTTILDLIR